MVWPKQQSATFISSEFFRVGLVVLVVVIVSCFSGFGGFSGYGEI